MFNVGDFCLLDPDPHLLHDDPDPRGFPYCVFGKDLGKWKVQSLSYQYPLLFLYERKLDQFSLNIARYSGSPPPPPPPTPIIQYMYCSLGKESDFLQTKNILETSMR